MTKLARFMVAAAVAGALAAPAAAQYPYPYPPQSYPPGYGQGTSVFDQIIGSLIGNRYAISDRTAIRQCAQAAVIQAQNQYRGYAGQQGYPYGQTYPYGGQAYPYGGQAYPYPYSIRVTAITDVERRSSGLRVRGLLDSGMGYGGQYGGYGQYGYDPRYSQGGDLSFRCNVDYRGYVTSVRVQRR